MRERAIADGPEQGWAGRTRPLLRGAGPGTDRAMSIQPCPAHALRTKLRSPVSTTTLSPACTNGGTWICGQAGHAEACVSSRAGEVGPHRNGAAPDQLGAEPGEVQTQMHARRRDDSASSWPALPPPLQAPPRASPTRPYHRTPRPARWTARPGLTSMPPSTTARLYDGAAVSPFMVGAASTTARVTCWGTCRGPAGGGHRPVQGVGATGC